MAECFSCSSPEGKKKQKKSENASSGWWGGERASGLSPANAARPALRQKCQRPEKSPLNGGFVVRRRPSLAPRVCTHSVCACWRRMMLTPHHVPAASCRRDEAIIAVLIFARFEGVRARSPVLRFEGVPAPSPVLVLLLMLLLPLPLPLPLPLGIGT